jgi:superfamily II DNA or RNA helicase
MINDETIIVKKVDEVNFRIFCSIGQSMELKEFFSCYAPNYKWHPKFRMRCWNGKISFYDMREKLLPIGFLPKIIKFCNQFNYEYKLDFDVNKMINDISDEDIKYYCECLFHKVKDKFFPRDYQIESIINAIRSKRGVIVAGTGAGKSLIFYTIVRFLREMNKKILIIVPNISLVEQAYNDFIDYGFDGIESEVEKLYAKYSDDFKNDKPIVISTYQSLANKNISFFKNINAVIIDEVHGVKKDSKSLQKILKCCTNASYRFGFSGTLPDEVADINTLIGYLGPVLYTIKSGELIEKGILSKIKIVNILLKYPLESIKECRGRNFNFETNYIMAYEKRNSILKYIIENTDSNKNILILVSRIDKHLKPVVDYLNLNFPNREKDVIFGGVDAIDRENIRSKMENKNGCILISTYQTVGTGWNLKNLHVVVFFSSYKSKIKVLQAVGRGLRQHISKDCLMLYDIIDDLSYTTKTNTVYRNYLYQHWLQRIEHYKSQGFEYTNKVIDL